MPVLFFGSLADAIGDWVVPLVKNNFRYVEMVLAQFDGSISKRLVGQLAMPTKVQRVILRLRVVHRVFAAKGVTEGWKYLRAIGGGNASKAIAHHLVPLEAKMKRTGTSLVFQPPESVHPRALRRGKLTQYVLNCVTEWLNETDSVCPQTPWCAYRICTPTLRFSSAVSLYQTPLI